MNPTKGAIEMSGSGKMQLVETAGLGLLLILIGTSIVFSQSGRTKDSTICGLPPSHKIDEYGNVGREDEKLRLEKLLAALAGEKNSHAFIVTYGGRLSLRDEAQKRADWAKRYLVETHGFFAGAEVTNAHINTLTCGYREVPATELWIIPVGAAPPLCAPTIAGPTPQKPRAQRRRQ